MPDVRRRGTRSADRPNGWAHGSRSAGVAWRQSLRRAQASPAQPTLVRGVRLGRLPAADIVRPSWPVTSPPNDPGRFGRSAARRRSGLDGDQLPHRRDGGVGLHRLAGRPAGSAPSGIATGDRRGGRRGRRGLPRCRAGSAPRHGRDYGDRTGDRSAAERGSVSAERRGLLPAQRRAVGRRTPWFTKITLLVWLAVAVLIIFFLVAYRNPKLVPTKRQWLAESIYGFVRNNIADRHDRPRGRAVRAVPRRRCSASSC